MPVLSGINSTHIPIPTGNNPKTTAVFTATWIVDLSIREHCCEYDPDDYDDDENIPENGIPFLYKLPTRLTVQDPGSSARIVTSELTLSNVIPRDTRRGYSIISGSKLLYEGFKCKKLGEEGWWAWFYDGYCVLQMTENPKLAKKWGMKTVLVAETVGGPRPGRKS